MLSNEKPDISGSVRDQITNTVLECYSRQVTFSDRIWLRMRIFFRTRIMFAILVIKSSHTLINTYTTKLMRIVIVTTL
jgi:hypothetical protein